MILEITIEILADPKATYILSSIHYSNHTTTRRPTTSTYPRRAITMKATKEILFLFLCKDCLTIIHLQVIPKFTKEKKQDGKNML